MDWMRKILFQSTVPLPRAVWFHVQTLLKLVHDEMPGTVCGGSLCSPRAFQILTLRDIAHQSLEQRRNLDERGRQDGGIS